VPVPVFCYFSILGFYQRKYSQNWTKQKPKFLFSRHKDGVQRRDRGGHRGSHTIGWRTPWPRLAMVWAPRASTDLALPPIYCLRRENPKSTSIHPWKVPQRRRHQRQVLRDRSLYSGTLPGRGIAPGAISIDSTSIFIVVADSHDEEGVVLPRGWSQTIFPKRKGMLKKVDNC
jgi:hypothetical protein